MDFKKFQEAAMRTEARIDKVRIDPNKLYGMLMIATASAEVADQIKKRIFYGRDINFDKVGQMFLNLEDGMDMFLGLGHGTKEFSVDPRILHGILGKFTESGEMLVMLQKHIHGAPLDLVNLGEEMGDDQWYNAILADAAGLDLDKVRSTIIAKLRARYPDKFTSEAAITRDLAAEREILETGLA